MARIRSIKPEVTESGSFGRLSREARLLFLLLFTIVDDEGRCRGSSRILASRLYPEDRDVDEHVDKWITELERERMARRYEVDGDTYLVVYNWLKHQKIDHPSKSKLPVPTEEFANPREPSRILAPDLDLGSGPGSKTDKPAAVPRVVDPVKDEIWKTGKALLCNDGMTLERAGSFLGKLVKDYGQKLVLDAVRECEKLTPAKPSEWLVARCQERRQAGREQRPPAPNCGNCSTPLTGAWSQSPKGRVCGPCHRGYMAGAWPERKVAE